MGRTKNLLQNNCAKEGLDYWKVVKNGGDGFKCEDSAEGCMDLSKFCQIKKKMPCWATSHGACVKLQLIYLPEGGVKAEKLDRKKPPITARDWYTSRGDCGCEYTLTVRLLADDMATELDKWNFTDKLEAGAGWKKVRYVFRRYPEGVRYVEFQHGGQDTKNWAGHYGVKMSNSAVFVGQEKGNKKQKLMDACGKNMLKNTCAKYRMSDWEVVSSRGNGWGVEAEAVSAVPVKEAVPYADESSCWVTSHGNCEKKQVVDLNSKGLDGDVIDKWKPKLIVSEWFSPRKDAGCHYWLKVSLLNKNMQEVVTKEIKESRGAGARWSQVSHTFSDYGDGVRFVLYSHGGRDDCNWAGHYGAKITGSSVVAEMDLGDSSSSSDED